MQIPRVILAFLLLSGFAIVTSAQEHEGKNLVEASLVADTSAIVPGQSFTAGLLLKMEPGWHTYWKYAGDAGLATRINWQLPEGFTAGPIQWPVPEKLIEPGDLVTFGYGNEVLLLVEITVPAELTDTDTTELTFSADASWLVCEEICIPGSAEGLTFTLPIANRAEPSNVELFNQYRSRLPSPNPPFQTRWDLGTDKITLTLTGIEQGFTYDFFPLPGDKLTVGHVTTTQEEAGTVTFTLPISDPPADYAIAGVVAKLGPDSKHTAEGWQVSSGGTAGEASASTQAFVLSPPAAGAQGGLLWNLLFGFLGGLILNVMPCVLPVITLKLMGFVKQAGESPTKIFRLGMAFVAGIFAWFFGIAVLASILRLSGSQLNWAFQFQNPYFVIAITAIIFVFSLNLLGVFEIILPGNANSRVVDLASREGYLGAFLHGVFATLLATPCLAPFLGTAVGFAVAQPPLVITAVFMAIAAGMAFPYVILSLRPEWIRFLPKPGLWMERTKQAMGFLLMSTVLWFLWIIGRQRGPDGMLWVTAFLLTLSVACWILGAFTSPMASLRSRRIGFLFILLIAGGGLCYFIGFQFANAKAGPATQEIAGEGKINWQPFSPTALEEAIKTGQPVFLDFTADWCLNCIANERLILNTDRIRAAFKAQKVIPMKADWTNADPEITKLLRSYGRAGVPTYAVYKNGSGTPQLLPEVLTPELVINSVQ